MMQIRSDKRSDGFTGVPYIVQFLAFSKQWYYYDKYYFYLTFNRNLYWSWKSVWCPWWAPVGTENHNYYRTYREKRNRIIKFFACHIWWWIPTNSYRFLQWRHIFLQVIRDLVTKVYFAGSGEHHGGRWLRLFCFFFHRFGDEDVDW